MVKRYDVIIVGAGPAGLMAAKAAGQNGFKVAILEKKPDIARLDRTCGQLIISMNEYYLGDLVTYDDRQKRFNFFINGFSVKYDGPYKNIYSWHLYAPDGHKIELGDVKQQMSKGNDGRIGISYDKEILLHCLLEEVQAHNVDIFPATHVEEVTVKEGRVEVEAKGDTLASRYLIAADGVNSRIAQKMGFNRERIYYCNLYALSWYMSGVEAPESNVLVTTYGFPDKRPTMFFAVPRAAEGAYNIIVVTLDPRLNLQAASDYFTKEAFCAPWFRKAKKARAFSAICNCYSPVVEPYKDHVLIIGDAGSTQDIENTGAMISGWRAGQAISTAIQETNLGLELSGVSRYINWWGEAFINSHNHETYLKSYALPHILDTEGEINYVFGLVRNSLRPSLNPYTSPVAKAFKEVLPTIKEERPTTFQKLGMNLLPASKVFAEMTEISRPV